MRKIFYLFSVIFMLLSCKEEPVYLGSESIKGKVSYKKQDKEYSAYYYGNVIYVQTETQTRKIEVGSDAYDNYKVGDPILLIIEKYQIPCEEKKNEDWKKPKINYHQINLQDKK